MSWIVIVAAAVHPSQGLGIILCPSRLITEVPCPGCGLSRSLSCAIRGDLAASVGHHPMGPIVLGLFAIMALLGVLPRRRRSAINAWVRQYPRLCWAVIGVVILAFAAIGASRAAGAFAGQQSADAHPAAHRAL